MEQIAQTSSESEQVGIRIDFIWQKGKETAIGKQVDAAAKAAAKRGGIDEDTGYRPGSASRSMVKGGTAQRSLAAGHIAVIRPYAKKVMHGGENRISFNIFDEALQTYTGKFYAFAGPVLSADLHRGNGHRVRFNSDPNYPQLIECIESVQLPKPPSKRSQNKP